MDRTVFARLEFALSIFHSYGHGIDCQIEFGPRNVPGVGLTDGESCERIWSAAR
jgi:hypothetical protein